MALHAAAEVPPVRKGLLQLWQPAPAHFQRPHAWGKGAVHCLLAALQEQGVPSEAPCSDAQRPPQAAAPSMIPPLILPSLEALIFSTYCQLITIGLISLTDIIFQSLPEPIHKRM